MIYIKQQFVAVDNRIAETFGNPNAIYGIVLSILAAGIGIAVVTTAFTHSNRIRQLMGETFPGSLASFETHFESGLQAGALLGLIPGAMVLFRPSPVYELPIERHPKKLLLIPSLLGIAVVASLVLMGRVASTSPLLTRLAARHMIGMDCGMCFGSVATFTLAALVPFPKPTSLPQV